MMKPLIAALALVTLFASPTFARPAARPSTQTEFVSPTDEQLCRSGQTDFCHWRGYPLWPGDSGAFKTRRYLGGSGALVFRAASTACRSNFKGASARPIRSESD